MTDPGRLDIAALLEALDRHGVRYVVAGSAAAAVHGADMQPRDLDIAPATDEANLRSLSAALAELGADAQPQFGEWRRDERGEWHWHRDGVRRDPEALDPGRPETFDHSFATPLGQLDVVPSVMRPYEKLMARASRREITGAERWVADPRDLLAARTAPRRSEHAASPGSVSPSREPSAGSGGVGFIGLRTDRFDEMVRFFGELLGLPTIRSEPGAVRFRLGEETELHVYSVDDPDHAFFTTGPVVGLLVDEDVAVLRERLEAAGVVFIGPVQREGPASWNHFEAPDGTVMELMHRDDR